jgi:transposase, IS30 family
MAQHELSIREMARRLGRAPSTIHRELKRNAPRRYHSRAQLAGQAGPQRTRPFPYRALSAQFQAERRAKRPKERKLSRNPKLRVAVEEKLKLRHSPEQVAEELRQEYPQDREMWVSDETIYKAMYVQGRGSLRSELALSLRSGRTLRKPRRPGQRPSRILGEVLKISQRPPEVEDRAVPGHWEGDLILGKQQRSAIGTLVERQTRFVMLLHLPNGHSPAEVERAMVEATHKLPRAIWKTLTWDRGSEMANHARITLATDLAIYFCDPSSPWQRGSNENTNGLLREYFPKGTDLRGYTADELDRVADEMNDRPRKTLGWKRPRQAMEELITGGPIRPPHPPGVASTP